MNFLPFWLEVISPYAFTVVGEEADHAWDKCYEKHLFPFFELMGNFLLFVLVSSFRFEFTH